MLKNWMGIFFYIGRASGQVCIQFPDKCKCSVWCPHVELWSQVVVGSTFYWRLLAPCCLSWSPLDNI